MEVDFKGGVLVGKGFEVGCQDVSDTYPDNPYSEKRLVRLTKMFQTRCESNFCLSDQSALIDASL